MGWIRTRLDKIELFDEIVLQTKAESEWMNDMN